MLGGLAAELAPAGSRCRQHFPLLVQSRSHKQQGSRSSAAWQPRSTQRGASGGGSNGSRRRQQRQGHLQRRMAVDARPHSPGWHVQVKDAASQDRGLVQTTPIEGVAGQHCCNGSMQVAPHATVPVCGGWVPAWVGACGMCQGLLGGGLLCAEGGMARMTDTVQSISPRSGASPLDGWGSPHSLRTCGADAGARRCHGRVEIADPAAGACGRAGAGRQGRERRGWRAGRRAG